jgi:hypothetical protein
VTPAVRTQAPQWVRILDYVYFKTEPMRAARPGQVLDVAKRSLTASP